MNKKKIAILFGGCSNEYDVSLQSAYAVISHIDTDKYQTVLIGINRDGEWFLFEGEIDEIRADTWMNNTHLYPAAVMPDKQLHGFMVKRNDEYKKISIDAAMPVLHGKNGEDGTVQGMLALAGIPLIGCDLLSSAVCMDKDMAHRIVSIEGIKVPKSFLISTQEMNLVKICGEKLGYPLFIKPLRAGSSFGITKVMDETEIDKAVEEAFIHDDYITMEEAINGFEVGCAVLGDEKLMTGEVDEITLEEGFFDYTEKYSLKHSQIHVPARISKEKAKEIKETALTIFTALRCRHFARVDMFLTPEGELYFNEVNTIPGFTQHSRYPGMLKAAGMDFAVLVNRLIEMGIKE